MVVDQNGDSAGGEVRNRLCTVLDPVPCITDSHGERKAVQVIEKYFDIVWAYIEHFPSTIPEVDVDPGLCSHHEMVSCVPMLPPAVSGSQMASRP